MSNATTSKKPTHQAFIVVESKAGSEKKSRWVEIGAVWPHSNGKGFDLAIPQGVSVSGRIVCLPKKDGEPSEAPGLE